MQYMKKNQQGLSLVEVLASLVIISVILIGFFNIFTQTNKTAHYNNDKLVLINLADAELERIQASNISTQAALSSYIQHDKTIVMNGKTYTISIEDTSSTQTGITALNLKHLKVTASINSSKSVAEGYVKITE